MQAFYSDHFVLPLPAGHRFPMSKYALLRAHVGKEMPEVTMREAPAATNGQLALVHTPEWIASISSGRVDPKVMRAIGFPWSEAMVERSRRSAGATIAAARAAAKEGIAGNMAGGTHHAYADTAGGFCVFNDAAVTARLMQTELRPRGRELRVAIVDLDVHQGNGTARIFQKDPSVFTLSIHGQKNFPFDKETSDLDVNLPDGCADDEYLHALDLALGELDNRFDADFAIYLAGADPHEGDRLGRLKLTYDGLVARDRRVFDWAFNKRIPLAFTMAGGYGKQIETSVQVQINTYGVALEYWRRWQNRLATESVKVAALSRS